MNILYECPICHSIYHDGKKCFECEESHKMDVIAYKIDLIFDEISKKYGFSETMMRLKRNNTIDTDIKCFGLYNGYPNFSTECLGNEHDVFMAKQAVLAKAIEWCDKYRGIVENMMEQLKTEKTDNGK